MGFIIVDDITIDRLQKFNGFALLAIDMLHNIAEKLFRILCSVDHEWPSEAMTKQTLIFFDVSQE